MPHNFAGYRTTFPSFRFQAQIFGLSVVGLTESLCQFFGMHNHQTGESAATPGIPESVMTEWSEFFVPSLFPTLLPAFVKLAGNSNAPSGLAASAPLLRALSCVLGDYMPVELLLEHELEPKFLVEDLDCDGRFEDKVLFLLNHLSPLLLSDDRNVQRCAHKLLRRYYTDIRY